MKKFILVIPILLLAMLACNSTFSKTESTTATASIALPTQTQAQTNIPLTEAGVPRISVEEANAAVKNGEAIIVDVRSAESFAMGHITGAISIPLDQFENNISNIDLEKGQWIITYCT